MTIENSLKLLIIASSIIITCGIISMGNIMFKEVSYVQANTFENLSKVNSRMVDSDILIYDNVNLNGSQVYNLTKKFQNEYSIEISTKNFKVIYNNANLIKENLPNSDRYIKQNSVFKCNIEKDKNETIVKIIFKEN